MSESHLDWIHFHKRFPNIYPKSIPNFASNSVPHFYSHCNNPSFLWGKFSGLKGRATITLLMPNARYHQKRSPTHHKMTITIANTDSMPNHARIVIIDERNIFGHTKSNNTSNYAHTTPHHRYYTENAIFILNNACKVENKHSNRYIDSYISQTQSSSQSPTNSDDTWKVKYSEKYCASNCEEHSRFGATHPNSQSLTNGYDTSTFFLKSDH